MVEHWRSIGIFQRSKEHLVVEYFGACFDSFRQTFLGNHACDIAVSPFAQHPELCRSVPHPRVQPRL